ncbi:MAG TPA: A/G-specific adenine glycosylase [Chloroflexota bacterium]|nr:A/G-specific adenine glycosylase [Chloroflexota bacterium]
MRPPPPPLALPEKKVVAVRRALVRWYRAHGRDLPWRRDRDPYRVLVSELMLQQQTVRHVTPVFDRFLDRFPTLEVLAAASLADVIRVWQPLGRYSSAVRLHAVARRLVGEAGGAVPATVAALLPLEGIGRYTAGAIVCFAHGIPAPLVDTNVRRVLGRIFAQEAPGAVEDDRLAWRLAEAVLPARRAYDWNQGLMDLGAGICIARTPRCQGCPVARWCAFRAGATSGASAAQPALAPAGRAGGSGTKLVAESRSPYGAGLSPGGEGDGPQEGGWGAGREAPRVRYEGSRRWYRGQIMQVLCALPEGESLTLDEVSRRVALDGVSVPPDLLQSLVAALSRDGLLQATGSADGAVRLSLPA